MRAIQIFGERCSGTNYLESLVQSNVKDAAITWEFGWKHFFPQQRIPPDTTTFFLVVHRNPFTWLQSLHRNPWHVAPTLRSKSFAEFIRAQWVCVYDEDSDTPPDDPRYGQEILFERDPQTGERFANVMQMRSAKIRAWEAIKERTQHVLSVRYEAIDERPQEFLRTLSEEFNFEIRKRPRLPVGYKGKMKVKKRLTYLWSFGTRGGYSRKQYPEIAAEDRAFIVQNLDLRLEQQIGYLKEYG